MFCLIGWLNFILKEWLTISRGAKPHAQKAKLENRKKDNIKMIKEKQKTMLKRVLEVVAKKTINKWFISGPRHEVPK